MQESEALIISLHPEHANKILSGGKKLEFRRVWANKPIRAVVIYSTLPVKEIVAIAYVKQIHFKSRNQLWLLAKSIGGGLSRRALYTYFEGKKKGYAIEFEYIKKFKSEIEHQGTKIVLVNMANEKKCLQELSKFDLGDVEYIGDSESLLYKAFKLKRGSFSQLYGFRVFVKGLYLWVTRGAFIPSSESADVYQMPGIFLIYKGAVVKQFIHQSVTDNPPYLELASYKSGITS